METYTLTLSAKHIQVIGEVLANAPYKMVVETINIIQQQVSEQDVRREVRGNGKLTQDTAAAP